MKNLFTVIAVCICVNSFAQDSTFFLTNWTNLKSQFLVKADAAKNVAIIAMDSRKVSETLIEKARGFAFGLGQIIKIAKEPDKAAIQRLVQFEDSLDIYIGNITKAIKNDQQFASSKAYAEFKKKFMSADTKLQALKYDFNQNCKKLNKNDLIFPANKNPGTTFD